MKANRMWLFSDVLEKNKRVFKVPVYQRNYDWSNIECEKLYQDIINAFDKDCQHFTGTLVYIDDVNGGSGLNEVLIIDGQQRITTIYILLKALYDAYDFDVERIIELASSNYSILNATRIYITNDERKLRKARQINNSGIYFETNLSANGIVSFIKDLLMQMKLEVDDFSFSLSEVPFSVNNEATWGDGVIPVAKLFYNFIEELTKRSLIKDSEIKKLKTKSYTKELFNATDYPALADNRTDNMGNSIQKRYRVKPIRFNGMDIFVSTQFFDSDRDAVIAWYKSHLS